jgi:hypothetical protein
MKKYLNPARAARCELLATTMLATFAMSSVVLSSRAFAQTAESGGTVALPTVEVEANKEGEGPGSSQGGAGLGGRFTGYTVDLNTPAVAGKDNTPILQTPTNNQVVPREVMDDQQISVQDAIVGYVSSVQPPRPRPTAIIFTTGSTSGGSTTPTSSGMTRGFGRSPISKPPICNRSRF